MPYCNDEETGKKKAAALLLLLYIREQAEQKTEAWHLFLQGRDKQRRRRKQRCCWARKWLSDQRRLQYGHFTTVLNELKTEDDRALYNYTRLPRGLFDEVLQRIQCRIEMKGAWYRKSLPPGLKLSITLRHLAGGHEYPSLSHNFRVAPNTISLLITEVCEAIKAEFAAEVIQCPTSEQWAAIAEQFEKRWQFPHCCGALDGKHIVLSCPLEHWLRVPELQGLFSLSF